MRKEYISYEDNLPIKVTYASIKEYPLHWHNSIEIIYILKGSLNVTIDTDDFEIFEKELEIINVEESHSMYSETDNKVLLFQIDPNFFEKYYADIKNIFFYTNSEYKNSQNSEEYDELRTLLSMSLCEIIQKQSDYHKEIESILVKLLYNLLNNFHYLIGEKETLKDNKEQFDRYHRISKYIFNNYNSNITLQEIAKKEFLSPHYLSHEIKSATGYTFTDLINQTRVEESIKLLLDSDLSISEISDEVGFSHLRYFNKNFKIYYGCTPLQYKKKFKISEIEFENKKNLTIYPISNSLNLLTNYLDNYERFNYKNKLWKIHIDVNNSLEKFNESFHEIISLGEAFDLLIEDNKDILEEIQEEIQFNYGRLECFFHSDMGIYSGNEFFNWNKAKSVLEFLDYIELKPLIMIDSINFSQNDFENIFKSFYDYFSMDDIINLNHLQFQFSSSMDEHIKEYLTNLLTNTYGFTVLDKDIILTKNSNSIFDSAFMLPYIIHNYIFYNKELSYLRAFDVLEKEIDLTNEVFIGSPGIVNDMGIKKPSYYAYYLLNKLKGNVITKGNGYIVTKNKTKYSILLYSYNDFLEDLTNTTDSLNNIILKKTTEKNFSLNIFNIDSPIKTVTYEINEIVGSSYNYWQSMGKPDRLNKEEKEILHKASFPKIQFKHNKKSSVINIIAKLKGYGAMLILINELK